MFNSLNFVPGSSRMQEDMKNIEAGCVEMPAYAQEEDEPMVVSIGLPPLCISL